MIVSCETASAKYRGSSPFDFAQGQNDKCYLGRNDRYYLGRNDSYYLGTVKNLWIEGRLFVAARTGHEFADGFFRALVVVKDGVHLFGDGHFDGVTCGQAEGRGGAADAFGYFSV